MEEAGFIVCPTPADMGDRVKAALKL